MQRAGQVTKLSQLYGIIGQALHSTDNVQIMRYQMNSNAPIMPQVPQMQ